jgi:hypothetical protein
MFDLNFYYKYMLRYMSYLKDYKNLKYYNNILKIEKLVLFVNCNKIMDINNNNILSSLFFFKYYFGVMPYFSNYKSEFKLNVYYYNFLIEYVYKKKSLFFPLYYFINDIYYFINKINLKILLCKDYWECYINDMNFFLEKKNSLGFFNLKYKLYLQLFFNINYDLLNFLKIKK